MERAAIERGLRIGTTFGIALVFVTLFGLLTKFATTPFLGLMVPDWMVGFLALSAGYTALGPAPRTVLGRLGPRADRTPALIAAGVAGLTFGVIVALLAWVAATIRIEDIFENLTPQVAQVLVGTGGFATGAVRHVLQGAILGLVGGAVRLGIQTSPLPTLARTGAAAGATSLLALYLILTSLVTLLGMVVSGLAPWVPTDIWPILRWSAISLAVGALLGMAAPFAMRPAQIEMWRRQYGSTQVLVGALAVAGLVLPLTLGPYWNQVFTTIGIFVMMGLGLNVVVGFAGLLDLGYVAFYALGAYTYAFLNAVAHTDSPIGLWALPVAMAVAALAGILLGFPVLRLRGDYLAIVTLGFGEIIRLVMNNEAEITGGPQGILQIVPPSLPGVVFNSPLTFYYLIVVGIVLIAFVTARLNDSRIGRAWVAMREDEDVARAMGIDTVRYKLMAFAIGAAMAGLGGAIFAARQRSIFPADFGLIVSIEALALIIIGGLGSIPGVIAGAVVLKGFPELLRELQEYRLLIYGALLVAMMLVRPEGILPSRRRAKELHGTDDMLEDQPREEDEVEREFYRRESAELRT